MSTRIYPAQDDGSSRVHLTRYAGTLGGTRGPCYQIDDEKGAYVGLSAEQAETIALHILADIAERKGSKK